MTRKIVTSVKDENGVYTRVEAEEKAMDQPSSLPSPDTSLDDILKRQLTALDRVTRQLAMRASTGSMTKPEIDALATCIKVTLELKTKENEILDSLSEEQIQEYLAKQAMKQSED